MSFPKVTSLLTSLTLGVQRLFFLGGGAFFSGPRCVRTDGTRSKRWEAMEIHLNLISRRTGAGSGPDKQRQNRHI